MGIGTSIRNFCVKSLAALCLRSMLLVMGAIWGLSAQAQSGDKWLEKGQAAFQDHDYPHAIEYLQWSIDHGGGWQSKLAMAECYRAQMNYAAAGNWYGQVVNEPGIPPSTYFYYGQALMTSKRYAEAEQWFARYTQSTAGDTRAAQFRNLDKLVASVKGDSMEFVVERMPINSMSSDFGPLIFQEGLLFVSGKPNELGVKHVSTIDDAPLLDIYYSKPDSNGRWSRPTPFNTFNSKLNEGPMALDAQRQQLYITRNDVDHNAHRDRNERRSLNRLRIERMRLADSGWIEDGGMPFNNTAYAVGHPTLTVTGNTMYFASDMPGGYGGTDLYRSNRIGDTWTAPSNLGPLINTAQDEMFPHLGDQGQLYFSSNGHLGLGGLDIFFVQLMANGEWSRVQNIGYPINSEADDFGIVTDRAGSHGYFASNRGNSPENDDIYAFLRDWPSFECVPMLENNYCFAYIDEGFLDIDTLPFAYEWSFGDGQKQRATEGYHCYDGPGEYHIEFNIIDTVLNVVFMNQNDYTLVVRDTPQVTITVPDTVSVDQQLELSAAQSVLEGCEIARYYWDLGDGQRGRGVTLPHAYAAVGTYEIKLGVTGLPSEDGSLVCKHCATKQIVVVTPAQLREIEVRRLEAREARLQLPDGPAPQLIRDEAQLNHDLPDSMGDVKYSVELAHSPTPINPRTAPYNGLKDLREVHDQGGYTLFQGLEDSLADIYPQFVQAKKLGFEDAMVVVLPDTFGVDGLASRATKIPFERTQDGVTLFLGEVRDANGNPLKAMITLEEFSRSELKFHQETDSLGRVELRVPNGKIYAWTAEVKDYLPVSGLLDLSMGSEAWHREEELRERIVMKQLSELAASGEAVVINNIFFDFDSDRLRPESVVQIQRIARVLIEYPEFGLEVSAHTDDVGNDAYNMDLSRRRAYAVLKYMIAAGYDVRQISSQGLGETQPFVPNSSPENRQLNRRVEFRLRAASSDSHSN